MDKWTYDEIVMIWKKQKEIENRIEQLENIELNQVQKIEQPKKKILPTKIRLNRETETIIEKEEPIDEDNEIEEEDEDQWIEDDEK